MENNNLAIPGAIIVAGIIIAGALVYVNNPGQNGPVAANNEQGGTVQREQNSPNAGPERPRQLDENDHIFGNPDAPILIVEYSDTECPFCKRFHTTLHDIVDEFDGQVAWIYRHFPIPSLHKKAQIEAEATECAAELGGNDAFWTFIDTVYEQTPSNDGLDLALLPEFAAQAGIDRKAFQECLGSSRHKERVNRDRDEAVATGGRGTPHSLVISEVGIFPLQGAQPIENVRSIINQILDEINS